LINLIWGGDSLLSEVEAIAGYAEIEGAFVWKGRIFQSGRRLGDASLKAIDSIRARASRRRYGLAIMAY